MDRKEVREALKLLGWKQADLARHCGVCQMTVCNWLGYDGKIPHWLGVHLGLLVQLQNLHIMMNGQKTAPSRNDDS